MSSKADALRPKWRYSIRSRLAYWYGGVLGGALVLLGVILYFYLAMNLRSDLDFSLQATAEALARSSLQMGASLPGADPDLLAENLMEGVDDPEFFSKFFQFFDALGSSGLHSRNVPKRTSLTPSALRNALEGKMTFETFSTPDQRRVRVLTFPVILQGDVVHVLQVGSSMGHIERVLGRVRFTLLLTLPTVLILALVGGWELARQALRPVDSMALVARQITAGDLSRRIPIHKGGDELARLAQTFNAMIERMEDSIQRLRQFSADASHELRTPLTILKGEAEMALRQARSVDEYQQLLASALEEIDRISKIVEDLFLLSKTDLGEARIEMKPVPLDTLVRETLSQMEPLAQENSVALVLDRRDSCIVSGDIYRLRELLLNLIENAIRYTPSGGKITVSLLREEKTALIQVSDTGMGISAEDLPRIFDRFYRSDDARSIQPKGSGLGLSICHSIVGSHEGQLTAESRLGHGSTFFVRLPLLSH